LATLEASFHFSSTESAALLNRQSFRTRLLERSGPKSYRVRWRSGLLHSGGSLPTTTIKRSSNALTFESHPECKSDDFAPCSAELTNGIVNHTADVTRSVRTFVTFSTRLTVFIMIRRAAALRVSSTSRSITGWISGSRRPQSLRPRGRDTLFIVTKIGIRCVPKTWRRGLGPRERVKVLFSIQTASIPSLLRKEIGRLDRYWFAAFRRIAP
jgi:hypothetical protein